jgi:hypothetical protein
MNAQNYGFIYNELIVDSTKRRLTKRLRQSLVDDATTPAVIQQRRDGERKLRKEIQFYLSIQDQGTGGCRIPPPFVMPRFYPVEPTPTPTNAAVSPPELQIQYFEDYEVLTERFPYSADDTTVIREILDHIRPLHEHSPRIQITNNEYKQALRTEVYDKIVERYSSVNWTDIYPEFERLTHVNGVKVRSFMEYATILLQRVEKTLGGLPPNGENLATFFTYIHGDIHLGNILIPKSGGVCIENDTPRYIFIDPRGYFASYDVFGDPHYDYAKLLFGISGYSVFDQMTIDVIDANDANDANELNINIPFIDKYSKIYESLDDPEWQSSVPELAEELTRLLSLSIWLGNNSAFISPHKKLTSLMISRYLCERYL